MLHVGQIEGQDEAGVFRRLLPTEQVGTLTFFGKPGLGLQMVELGSGTVIVKLIWRIRLSVCLL